MIKKIDDAMYFCSTTIDTTIDTKLVYVKKIWLGRSVGGALARFLCVFKRGGIHKNFFQTNQKMLKI